MDPEQVRAAMKERRERIDSTLDLLQARVVEARGQFKRAALGGTALMLIPRLYNWAKRRRARASRT